MNTVVGLIESRTECEKVIHDLEAQGIGRGHIHIVAGDQDPEATTPTGEETGFRGLLVKLGLLEARRRELGLPAEHVGYYSEGVRRGGYLVTVDADSEAEMDKAVDVLEDHGAVDIEERAAQWQQSGWSAGHPGATATTGTSATGAAGTVGTGTAAPLGTASGATAGTPTWAAEQGEAARIPVVEEELKVGKRAVRKGGVRVYSHVSEQPVSEAVTLREEHVDVARRPVDRPVTDADLEAFKEGTIELAETAEEVVTAKEARVVEEVVVSKGVTEHTETVQDTVRRTDVEVEPLATGAAGRPLGYADYADDFRRHYASHFGDTGQPYERYEPAYRFGHSLASDPAHAGRDWAAVETAAQSQWEQRHPGTWDTVKNAVHHAWERLRGHH